MKGKVRCARKSKSESQKSQDVIVIHLDYRPYLLQGKEAVVVNVSLRGGAPPPATAHWNRRATLLVERRVPIWFPFPGTASWTAPDNRVERLWSMETIYPSKRRDSMNWQSIVFTGRGWETRVERLCWNGFVTFV